MTGSMGVSPRWIQEILSPSRFIPHGHCYLWDPELVWLHVLSDALIAIAYFSIPIMLIYFVQKREDVPFRGVFLLFGLFIVTCGTTHLMSVWTLWHPAYWLSGVIKAITAVVSAYTALTLLPTIPQALALPSPEKIRQINQQLEKQIEERTQAELALRQSETRLQMALEVGKTSCWEQDLATQQVQGFGWLDQGIWQPTAWQTTIDSSFLGVHPDDRGEVRQAFQSAIASGGEFALEHRMISTLPSESMTARKSAERPDVPDAPDDAPDDKWVLTRGKVLTNSEGQPARISGLTVDVTERKLAEVSLKVSEDRWQLALIGTNDGIWDWNIDTNEVFMSPRFKQMLGYEVDAWPNEFEEWAKRVHPSDRDRVVAAMQAHIDNETPFYMTEHRFLGGDGSYKWVLDRAKVLRDDTGKAVRMTGSTSDITARKQADEALKQLNQELEARVEERTVAVKKSELRFRSLFESAPDFIYILDAEGIVQQVNPTVVNRSGYAKTELIAQPLTQFFTVPTQVRCQSDFSNLLTEGNHRQEMEFVCKDGQVLTMDCSCTVVNNDEAEDYILVLQRDITQRKKDDKERAELLATLQESERRWQSFLDNVQLLVLELDASGQVNYVNPCLSQLMGLSKSQAIGKNWFDSFALPSERQPGQAAFQDILNRTDRPNYESSVVTEAGEARMVSWNTTLLQDTQGRPAGTLSIGEDITERNAIDRMKNEFISVVSHELRTPLTAIHGALDLLGSGLIDPQSDRGQHVFAIAVENSDRLVKLVNDILELERLESGKINLNQASVSTRELTYRTFELMELMAERAGITMVMPETDLLVWVDSDRIIQVLTNLVGNAIKFSEGSAKVWVTVEKITAAYPQEVHTKAAHIKAAHIKETQGELGREFVRFTVKDEGRGIPLKKIEGIFERFHQVDASDSRSKGGTGLGLAICRSIVDQHGGDISVRSTLGEGSEFFFTVPIDSPHP